MRLAVLPRALQFPRRRPQKPVGELSGGERGRLHLAKMLMSGAKCCCSTSRRTTSTSRRWRARRRRCWNRRQRDGDLARPWFLDRIATHILAFEDEAQVRFFSGNYQEYEAEKKKRLGEEAARPHRMRFKPLAK